MTTARHSGPGAVLDIAACHHAVSEGPATLALHFFEPAGGALR